MENSYGDDDRNNTEGAQTAEGVTITDLMLGYGPLAQEGDTVRVSRVARLQNGEGFDVSDRVVLGRPRFVGRPDDIFQCWDLGVIGMAIDGERRLTIPAHLANHKRVIGVPPNCQLTFDIRLLDI
ncbi:FKBP-like protein, partial [Trichoderma reesei RUT C-30]